MRRFPNRLRLKRLWQLPKTRTALLFSIDAPEADVKSVRINVTMPADILDQIDRYAEREGFTRSGFSGASGQEGDGLLNLEASQTETSLESQFAFFVR